MTDRSNQVKLFWDQYITILHSKGIQPPVDRWYVVRAEEYIKANRSRKLQQYGKTEVENWLILLGRKSSLQDWQLKQACHAIQILFQDLLEIDWVTTFDWEHSNPARYWVRTILTCPKSTIYSAKHALAMAIYCR